MKNYLYGLLLVMLVSLGACNKNDKSVLNKTSDKMDARIAAVTNTTQTKYGSFVSSASIEGSFKPEMKISFFEVGPFEMERKPTGMFFASTTMDPKLTQAFPLFYGSSLDISLNRTKIPKVPAVPYVNAVTLEGSLLNWQVSKSKGITLRWKIRNLTNTTTPNVLSSVSNFSDPSQNSIMQLTPIDIPQQVEGSTTVVAIIPDDLRNTQGTSLYWVVDANAQTFTIDPGVLASYGVYENITITIGSGYEYIYNLNGSLVNIVLLNTTVLPGIQLIE